MKDIEMRSCTELDALQSIMMVMENPLLEKNAAERETDILVLTVKCIYMYKQD